MRYLLIVWLINALALLALPYVVPSCRWTVFVTALAAAPLALGQASLNCSIYGRKGG